MSDDTSHLRQYATTGSEPAFAEIVRRHLDLVYFAALRRCGGDAHRAEDVTQQVFTTLARDAGRLVHHPTLTGWLYVATRNIAAKSVRAEQTRSTTEREAMSDPALASGSDAALHWEQLRPMLDGALDELGEEDRDAILLRYFESQPFGEIGHALRVSEDAARMRVDRALEKLRHLLARRGITSSTVALATAMGQHAAYIKPAGLAASVTAAALGGASAITTAGGGLVGLLTGAKATGSSIALAAALVISGGANAYLLRANSPAKSASQPFPMPAVAAQMTPPAVEISSVLQASPEALRDQLRAAGASDTTTRGIVEGVLRRRYRERLSAIRAEQSRNAWWTDISWRWQPARGEGPPRFVDHPRLLREMVLDPLDRLFGPDPVELAEYEAKFEFLPKEKRQAFAALERNSEAARARLVDAEQSSLVGDRLKREHEQNQQQLLAALTAAERNEYDLHFSPTAVALRERMSQIAATEQEYRAIMAVVGPAAIKDRSERGVLTTSESNMRAVQQLIATLGWERALDYVWAGAWEYPAYARVAREAGLPANTPARMLQLAAKSTARAADVHYDPAISPAQKRAAVLALQADVQRQLDRLLPRDQQQKLGKEAMAWFTALGAGSYKLIVTTLARSTGGVIAPFIISVESPRAPDAYRSRGQFVMPEPQGG